MTRARLVTVDEISGWQDQVRAALARAQAVQKASLTPLLTAHGLTWRSPVPAGVPVWSQDTWADAVTTVVAPVAAKVASATVRAVHGRVARAVRWGAADPTDQLTAMLVDKAIAAGPKIGAGLALTAAALDARFGGVTHPESKQTVLDAYQGRFVELDRLTERVVAHMSDAAQQLLAETAADRGPGVQYVWNAVGDERTRPDHLDADGQPQPAGVAFDVGGESLLYPGDPAGSDENIDNCRCWLEVEGVNLDRDFERSLVDS